MRVHGSDFGAMMVIWCRGSRTSMGQLPRPLNPHASPWAGFGAALRTLRVDRGLSQAQLGRAVHVSGDLIGKIEKAQRNPQPDIVNRLDLFLRADGRLLAAAAESTTSARGVPPVPDATAVPVVPSGLPAPLAVVLLGGVRQVLAGCRRLDHALGPAAVVDTVATQLAITQAALPESRGPDRDELLSTLAQLHQFVGWMAF